MEDDRSCSLLVVMARKKQESFEDKEESLGEIWSKMKFMIAWWTVNHKLFRGFYVSDVAWNLSVLL